VVVDDTGGEAAHRMFESAVAHFGSVPSMGPVGGD
jgi:hypothetical protein